MSLAVAAVAFGLIFPAELPDKSFFTVLVLSARYPAKAVWAGAAGAFAVQCAMAVAAGGLVSLLPDRLVQTVAALLFLAGAVIMWRSASGSDEETEEAEADEEVAVVSARSHRTAVTAFIVMFVAEWGDLTQILTATLAARYDDPVSVFSGAVLALWAVAALAAVAGQRLRRNVPLVLVQRFAAGLFAVLAVLAAVEAVRG